ncbi:recombinase family protein [Brevundimonas sp.]|uniref:recombinase family protein n=1 Tax=Brevundimonas sp. TaxID=1871086 RepID=UPI002897FF2D|nr:recombinase family protein [Brevundimonas sp.]
MARTFAYCRVSTADQTTDNQIKEIEGAGFSVEPKRIVSETISGSVASTERPGFSKLVDRLEEGDVLIVTKLDRLGRNAMDVRATVERLAASGVRVHCLALGGVDLTSAAGKMTMGVIAAVSEFERDLLIERTQAGLNRARAQGRSLGRPAALSEVQQAEVLKLRLEGVSLGALAAQFSVSRAAIQRIEKKQAEYKG